METLTTYGIKVSVQTHYRPEYSNPDNDQFYFAYQITIENHSSRTVQLKRRKWVIHDSLATVKEVRGDGVVGKQPVLAPGESFEYESYCPLTSDVGKMGGIFFMEDTTEHEFIEVKIPEFLLCTNFRAN